MARVAQSRRRRAMAPLIYAKVRRRLESRTKEQRRAASLLGHMRSAALSKDVKLELTRQLETVADLSNKHNVAPEKVKKLLMHHRRNRTSTVNPWNVHLHAVGEKVNGALPKGQKKSRAEILQIALASYEDFKNLPAEERTKAMLEYEDFRTKTTRGIRSEAKSRSQEVDQVSRRISTDLTGMGVRCGTSSLFFTVRSEHTHTNAPCFFIDDTGKDFLQNFFEITPQEFAARFENYALYGVPSLGTSVKAQKNEYKRSIWNALVMGLQDITKLEIQMEYKNYASKIVLAHRVVLQGWPVDMPIERNIDSLSIQNLRLLVAKLRSKEIHWAAASEEELRHIAEHVPTQQRAGRSDKGEKRTRYKKRKQNTAPDRGDNEEDSDGTSKKTRKRKQHTSNKPALVDDNDNNNNNNNNNCDGNGTSKKARKRKRRPVNDVDNNSDSDNDNPAPAHRRDPAARKGKGRSTRAQSSASLSSTHSNSRLLDAGASGHASTSTGSFSSAVDALPPATAQPSIGSLRDALNFPLPDLHMPPDDGFLRLPTPLRAEDMEFSSFTLNNTSSSPMDSSLMFTNFNYL